MGMTTRKQPRMTLTISNDNLERAREADHRGGTMTLTLEDGTEIPLTRDAHGFIARHDGQVFHLTATITGTACLTPAKWVARG